MVNHLQIPRSSNNVISSFKIIADEAQNSMIGDAENINYELHAYSRENDELRNKCNKLEQ